MKKPAKWKQTLLAIAIALVFSAFVFYGIATVYKEPRYEDFCDNTRAIGYINNSAQCDAVNGTWNAPYPYYPKAEGQSPAVPAESQGYCDVYAKCGKAFNEANDAFRKNLFIIALVAGAAGLVIGILVTVSSVSAGLMGGGIITMFIGIVQYWDRLADLWRFGILGILLAALIWIGYKKLK